MDNQIRQVLENVEGLATTNQLPEMAEFARDLLMGMTSPYIALVAPAEVDTTPFKTFLQEHLPEVKLRSWTTEMVSSNPALVQAANGVIAYFSMGRINQLIDIEAVENALFSRPPKTYAVVYSQAEVDDKLDFTEVDGMLKRTFVEPVFGSLPVEDLAQMNCFLWRSEQEPGLVQDRIVHDTEVLLQWLKKIPAGDPELLKNQMLVLLDGLEEAIKTQFSRKNHQQTQFASRAANEREEISAMKNLVLRRLDESQRLIQTMLTDSLETLRLNLRSGWEEYITRNRPASVANFRRTLEQYIEEGRQKWIADIQLTTRFQETIGKITDVFEEADWTNVNTLLTQTHQTDHYPEELSPTKSSSEIIRNLLRNENQDNVTNKVKPQQQPNPTPVQWVVSVAIIAGVLTTLGTIPALLSVAGLGGLWTLLRKNTVMHNYVLAGEDAINQFIQQQDIQIRTALPEIFGELREHFRLTFNRLLEHLNAIADQKGSANSDTTSATAPDEQIEKMRQTVIESIH